jgi:putative ABC transport system ATP-binding protein
MKELYSAHHYLMNEHIAIQARGLCKWFGEADARTLAVSDVHFTANFGEMLFIVGPSGSGKTTFLSMISGILRPSSGSVEVMGEDLWAKDNNALADFRLNHMGFVFQDFHLFPRLTTAENVAIPLILRGENWDRSLDRAREMLRMMNLGKRLDILPIQLSGGEQQRVAIARSLVAGPEILVMDEPTASLDGDTGKRIIAFVKEKILNPQRCILIVTHDARINEFADRIVYMENGKISKFESEEP